MEYEIILYGNWSANIRAF